MSFRYAEFLTGGFEIKARHLVRAEAEGGQETGDTHEQRVSPLKLLFDLVFVFAFTQVTAFLADHLTWVGMLQGVALLAALPCALAAYETTRSREIRASVIGEPDKMAPPAPPRFEVNHRTGADTRESMGRSPANRDRSPKADGKRPFRDLPRARE